MQYLIVDSRMPPPYATLIWSPKIENATRFSSVEDANAAKNAVADATGVIGFNDGWYVVKKSL
jgi:hypothetical protein